MRTLKNLLAAGAASLISSAALAADLPPPPPMYVPPPVEDFGGWYLRGDIGFSNQQVKRLDNALYYTPGTGVQNTGLGFDTAGIFGLGAGYRFNNWLRADVTGEYRGKSNFHGTDLVSFNGVPSGVDNYGGSKSEWLVLANVYADLGTWWCITPFVGVGIGGSRNTISGFTDAGLTGGVPSFATAPSASKWNFAWAAHAGLAYKVNPSLTLELAYRYVDLGDALSGDIVAYDGTNNINNPMHFKGLTSHDLKLGMRWAIDPVPSYAPPMLPPLIRKG
jgi:opacity protein-like surface antigen